MVTAAAHGSSPAHGHSSALDALSKVFHYSISPPQQKYIRKSNSWINK